MKNLNLRSKLLFISIVPLCFIFIFVALILQNIVHKQKNLELTQGRISQAKSISNVLHTIQSERDIVLEVISKKSVSEENKLLSEAVKNSNLSLKKAKNIFIKDENKNPSNILEILEELNVRDIFNLTHTTITDAQRYYTNYIASLLDFLKILPTTIDEKENRNYLQAYIHLALVKEGLAQTKTILTDVFRNNIFFEDRFVSFRENLKVCRTNRKEFRLVAPKEILAFYDRIFNDKIMKETLRIIDTTAKKGYLDDLDTKASLWTDKATASIALLKRIENELFKNVQKLINKKLTISRYQIIALLSFLLLSTIFVTLLMLRIMRKILFSTDTLEKEHNDSLILLEQYKQAVDKNFIVSKTDKEGNITYVNDNFCKSSGFTKKELLGEAHNIIRHPDTPSELFKSLWFRIKELKEPWFGEIKNRKKDGSAYWVKAVISPVTNSKGNIVEYMSIKTDISEIKDALIKDLLTGYENRFKLHDDIALLQKPSLAILNIDDFSKINDFYGHTFGDTIIVFVANTIYESLANNANLTLYRLQGDEFAILNSNEQSVSFIEIVSSILERIQSNIMRIDEEKISVRCSCGISFEEKEVLLATADMALKIAKKSTHHLLVYDASISLHRKYKQNIDCTRNLFDAIKNENLVTYFQPIVNNKNLLFEKYESLIRIDHNGTILAPPLFLNIAKQTRQYFAITRAVIAQSFELFKDKEAEFSINISTMDMQEPKIIEYILQMLQKYDIGSRVVFEIVESEYIENFQEALYFINEVKKYDCKIAIDDFGTGYSNFAYLAKLDADYLKIDGSLIKNIDIDKNTFLIVSTIVEFAKKLGIQTIAEFVENEKIFTIVKDLGIDYSQGNYFGVPKKTIQKDYK